MARVLHGMPLSSLPDAGTVKDEDQMVAYRSEDGQAYRTSVSDLIMGDYLDKVYPVGSIYMSINANNPADLFGGEWEQIQDRFLLAAGDSHSSGETGGAETVTLTSSQIPSHTHSFSATTGSSTISGSVYNMAVQSSATGLSTSGSFNARYTSGDSVGYAMNVGTASSSWTDGFTLSASHTHSVSGTTGSTGSGSSHNNMPPYLTVYMWQRIA